MTADPRTLNAEGTTLTEAATIDEETVSLDRDSLTLYRALTRLARVYQFRDRDKICVRGISVTQCYALTTLESHGPMTLNQLASQLYLDKSTVSRVVDAMEQKGIVQRRPHSESRRAIELRPTAKGKRLHTAIRKDIVERERQLLAGFDPKTRAALIDLIGRLVEEVEERSKRGVSTPSMRPC